MSKKSIWIFIPTVILIVAISNKGKTTDLPNEFTLERSSLDTIPPISERKGDFLTEPNINPFDLKDPPIIEKKVEYDPTTGQYIVREVIGDFNFRPPTYLTTAEYLALRQKEDERRYFRQIAGIISDENGINTLDPIAKIDVGNSLLDRLFGGTEVKIEPQGNIDLKFGADFQRVENPILTERQRTQGGFDFDMDIQMNVSGKIGDKLNLTTNYNTKATFDFDNTIKLDYNSDLFGEDDIIKKIEAGNVSLPLNGSLIQGAQSLFGLKTEMQFGHLRLTAIASQQKSQRESIQIEGGSQLQEFEVKADEYDENRHFFLSHYNREIFEPALSNLPQIKTLFKLENIEVWITNDRNEVDNVRDIIAFADLGEAERLVSPDKIEVYPDPPFREIGQGKPLPDNNSNGLYKALLANPAIRGIDQAVSILQNDFGLQQAKDFEKVSARKLKPQEYTVHPELGIISLNVNVLPDQVVGISYQYAYNGRNYKVGELSANSATSAIDSSINVLFVKLLKSTTQRTDVVTWDLMMKNIYSIGAFQVNQEDFKLDVFYDDPGKGFKRFLPESNLAGRPLLRVFNLDILNVQGDPQPDGVFDFVPGVTINPSNGRIMFPVLEPFGSSLANQIEDEVYREKYTFQELYDETKFIAGEFPEKNRFTIKGSYKSSVASEISLGAFNIPKGSVQVSAGGQRLVEGVDYEIDYNIGRLKILNDAILASGVPVNVSYEDNTLFGFQTKSMFGVRADYDVDENFTIGATLLKLFERPFTPKVNIGDDPINNTIYGLDFTINREAPWITSALDALPFYSTSSASSISLSAEAAALKPGHSRAINQNRDDKGGVVYIDDFEGAANSFDLRQPVNQWFLASVPQNDSENNNSLFPESNLINDTRSGANRALLNWYRIDQISRVQDDNKNPYTSLVPQQEVFPNLQLTPDQLPNIQTLDLTFYPSERGPYNFDVPEGYPGYTRGLTFVGEEALLRDPQTRWGGIMRAMTNNDFQSANIEFLEFWMLSPFLDPENPLNPSPNVNGQQGELYINLGNVSEDILRDSRKFFENGLPGPANPDRRVDQTNWSVVPVAQQITRAFDNDPETRSLQDVGLDGMDNELERLAFADYLEALKQANPIVAQKVEQDPSNDDYRYYNDAEYEPTDGVYVRYKKYNNTQGNSQANTGGAQVSSSTNIPDAEDLNRDNTLNETEAYFQYRIPLRANPLNPRELDLNRTPFITDRIESEDGRRVWYRFRVPLNGPEKVAVGGIKDFRSIRFMRMYLNGFEDQVTLRFARMELVRNQWRRYNQDLSDDTSCNPDVDFDVDAVNIEENSSRAPFSYVLPEGIQREQSLGVFNALQNEQSLTLNIKGLCEGEEKSVFKTINLDTRMYERLKMFVHAEALNDLVIDPGEMSVFVRLGSDFKENYYEYEIPLLMSDPDNLPTATNTTEYKLEVWRPENEFDVGLKDLVAVKQRRNQIDFSPTEEYVETVENDNPNLAHQIKVKGNPNLGYVKIAMIGVRNRRGGETLPLSTEVWLNEFRLTGLNERGGVAALARMDVQLADLGNVTLAGNYSSIGFGAIDQKVQQRSREDIFGYDFATTLELGRLLPSDWGFRIPFYGSISKNVSTPEFDPYDLDIVLKEKIRDAEVPLRDSIRNQAVELVTLKSYNFTNVRKEGGGGNGQRENSTPWDPSNISVTYGYTESNVSDPIIELDQRKRYNGGLDYRYSRSVKYLEPFKNLIKSDEFLGLLKNFNLNPLPNSFTFSTLLDRRFNTTKYRFTGLDERYSTFYNKKFTWNRDYNLQWDFTKSIKFSYSATNASVIDEPDELEMAEDPTIADIKQYRRDSIMNNIRNLGRSKNYNHSVSLSYTLPVRYLPYMDWVNVRGQYQASYGWTAAALNVDSLGNFIRNSQDRQLSADLNFESLYNKIPYLRSINRGGRNSGGGNSSRMPSSDDSRNGARPSSSSNEGMPSGIERALIRPLMLIRNARVTYRQSYSTSIPGFMPEAKLMGLSPGFDAPGWDFVAGLQPRIRELTESEYGTSRDWLGVAASKGWISKSVFLNMEVVQDYQENLDMRMTLEPFNDFRIDLEATRRFTETHTEYFKDTLLDQFAEFTHNIPKDVGSLTVSYSALNTLFQDSRSEIINLFRTFENNRVVISRRLGTGNHSDPVLSELGYTEGYGRTQQDVLIPAFLSAYEGTDPQVVGLNIFDILPKVNWRLSYNGLSKLPFFRDIFQNFTIDHAYKSTLTVNSFGTGLDYLRTRNDGGVNELNGNFYPRLEMPQVGIQESFSPLVSISATTRSGMSLSLDYNKDRNLAMSFISNQLSETQTKEFVISFGYLMRDVDIPFLTGKGGGGGAFGGGMFGNDSGNTPARAGQLQGKDLDINFNLRMRDDVTFNHLLDQGIIEPTRGNYSLSLSPSVEYKMNQRLSLRLFFDYNRNVPKTSAGFPRTETAGGIIVRFALN